MNINKLIWDKVNIAHIAKHNVDRDEVEEVCQRDALILDAKSGRIALIGKTHSQRTLTVILDPEEGKGAFYPATARDASRKERRLYAVWEGGDKAA